MWIKTILHTTVHSSQKHKWHHRHEVPETLAHPRVENDNDRRSMSNQREGPCRDAEGAAADQEWASVQFPSHRM